MKELLINVLAGQLNAYRDIYEQAIVKLIELGAIVRHQTYIDDSNPLRLHTPENFHPNYLKYSKLNFTYKGYQCRLAIDVNCFVTYITIFSRNKTKNTANYNRSDYMKVYKTLRTKSFAEAIEKLNAMIVKSEKYRALRIKEAADHPNVIGPDTVL